MLIYSNLSCGGSSILSKQSSDTKSSNSLSRFWLSANMGRAGSEAQPVCSFFSNVCWWVDCLVLLCPDPNVIGHGGLQVVLGFCIIPNVLAVCVDYHGPWAEVPFDDGLQAPTFTSRLPVGN